ncbi:MAG: ATP-binding cassette domain-containing protein [Clostridia bacterium]|nr:ATP-binding cassette domain-containing protein [Clostridia bacterium]
MIELINLSKTYASKNGDVEALKDINITVEDGDIFGIIGLSGAGKSTLVRCINLLERPTAGSVVIDGENLVGMPKKRLLEIRRKIGMIFQGFNLLEQRTAAENIRFPLELAGVKKADAAVRVSELLELVGLSDKAKAYPCELSGGQKQRIAIARALATQPKYLLCDEATSALDPNTTASILELLKEINQKLGVTVVIITHEMKVIESVCTKVAVLDHSRVAEIGNVTEVFADPQSSIAKELIIPDLIRTVQSASGGKKLRLIFRGELSDRPIISALALDLGVSVNILFADTKSIAGKTHGHMVIALNEDEVDKVTEYLSEKHILFKEEI